MTTIFPSNLIKDVYRNHKKISTIYLDELDRQIKRCPPEEQALIECFYKQGLNINTTKKRLRWTDKDFKRHQQSLIKRLQKGEKLSPSTRHAFVTCEDENKAYLALIHHLIENPNAVNRISQYMGGGERHDTTKSIYQFIQGETNSLSI